jgi:hypothetical protein
LAKVEASLQARQDDLDRVVAANVEALVELKKFSTEMTEKTSLDEITTNAKKALPFKSFQGVLDRLSREGAIDPQLKSRAMRVAQEYQKAVDSDMTKGFEHSNTQAMVMLGFKRYLNTTTREAYASLDRQLAVAAGQGDALVDKMGLAGDRKTAVMSRLRGAGSGAKRAEAMSDVFFNVLSPEERQSLLKAANPKLFEEKPGAAAPGASVPGSGAPTPDKR